MVQQQPASANDARPVNTVETRCIASVPSHRDNHTTAGIRLSKSPLWGIQGAGQAKEKRGEARTDAEKHGRFLSRVYLLNPAICVLIVIVLNLNGLKE